MKCSSSLLSDCYLREIPVMISCCEKPKTETRTTSPQECIPKQQRHNHDGNSFAVFFWMLPQEYVLESGLYIYDIVLTLEACLSHVLKI